MHQLDAVCGAATTTDTIGHRSRAVCVCRCAFWCDLLWVFCSRPPPQGTARKVQFHFYRCVSSFMFPHLVWCVFVSSTLAGEVVISRTKTLRRTETSCSRSSMRCIDTLLQHSTATALRCRGDDDDRAGVVALYAVPHFRYHFLVAFAVWQNARRNVTEKHALTDGFTSPLLAPPPSDFR